MNISSSSELIGLVIEIYSIFETRNTRREKRKGVEMTGDREERKR